MFVLCTLVNSMSNVEGGGSESLRLGGSSVLDDSEFKPAFAVSIPKACQFLGCGRLRHSVVAEAGDYC